MHAHIRTQDLEPTSYPSPNATVHFYVPSVASHTVQARDDDEALTAHGNCHACLARESVARQAQLDFGSVTVVGVVENLIYSRPQGAHVARVDDACERPAEDMFGRHLKSLVKLGAGEAEWFTESAMSIGRAEGYSAEMG